MAVRPIAESRDERDARSTAPETYLSSRKTVSDGMWMMWYGLLATAYPCGYLAARREIDSHNARADAESRRPIACALRKTPRRTRRYTVGIPTRGLRGTPAGYRKSGTGVHWSLHRTYEIQYAWARRVHGGAVRADQPDLCAVVPHV